MLEKLLLLGTVHNDPAGYDKALRFLEEARPDLVLVELSPFARVFRRRHKADLEKLLVSNLRKAATRNHISFRRAERHPRIGAIRRQIDLPFEYMAACAYTRRHCKRMLLVDYSLFSRRLISSWPELVSIENLATLLSLPSSRTPTVSREYRLAARRVFLNGLSVKDVLESGGEETLELWRERERHMARQITIALEAFKPYNPIYIGGWWHLTAGGSIRTLREILDVPLCRCFLLDEEGARFYQNFMDKSA
jgi:hypothetical protein